MAKWKIDAGNSSTGQIGFVAYDIIADTKEAALAKVCDIFPESFEDHFTDNDGARVTVLTYFNINALTLDNIEEDDG